MASSAAPDIRVRLTAEGVQDVINSFRKVSQEAKNITPGGLPLISGALKEIKGLLPGISFALVLRDFVGLAAKARETAENVGKLAEKSGGSVGTLSALSLAAHDSEVEFDSLSKGVVKLAKAQADAAAGASAPLKAFNALGVSVQDLNQQNPADLFVKVAQKMADLPPGANRTRIALELFGKSGADLIPLLDSLGKDGFDQVTEKAKKLGLYLNNDAVNSARAAQDALHTLEDASLGLATKFGEGFFPKATQGIQGFADALTGKGVNALKTFGDYSGQVFQKLLEMVTTDVLEIGTFFKNLKIEFDYYKGYLAAVNKGQGQAYRDQNSAAHDAALAANQQSFKDSLNRYKAALNRPFAPTSTGGGGGADGDGTSAESREKAQRAAEKAAAEAARLAAARSSYLQAQADNEISILRTRNQIEEAEDKRAYDAGLLTIDQYYDAREARAAKENAAELDQLKNKLSAAQTLPDSKPELSYRKQQEIAKIQTQITEQQLKSDAQLKASEDERSAARIANADKQLEITKRLQTAEGDREGAARTALELELSEYRKLLEAQGKSTDEIEAATGAYRKRAEASAAFQQNQKDASDVSQQYGTQGDLLDAQASSGQITGYSAEGQKLALQREELDLQTQIGLQMFKNAVASEDPDKIRDANAYNASLSVQRAKLQDVTTAATYLKNTLATEGQAALGDFFHSIVSGSKSAGEAFEDLGESFISIIEGMIAKLLVFYTLELLLGWIGFGAGDIAGMIGSSPFSKGFASGGYTGGGSTSAVAGVVHGQEFVVNADSTAKNRSVLEAINAGMDLSVRSPESTRQALGTSGDGGPMVVVNVTNTTGQSVSQTRSTGSNGQELIEIMVGAVAQSIASGGKVGQQIQQTFGAVRQGVRRG